MEKGLFEGSKVGCIKRLQRRAKVGEVRSVRFMRTLSSFLTALLSEAD